MPYSDDELLSYAQHYGIKTKRPPAQPSYSDDELLSYAQHYGIKTKRQTTQPRQPKNALFGGVVENAAKGADSFVNTIESYLPESKRFFDDSAMQMQERLSGGSDYEAAKRGATMLGAAKLADTAINFLPNVIDNVMGVDPTQRRRYSNLAQGMYNNSPYMQEMAGKYPATYGTMPDVAETVLPLPGRAGELIGGSVGKALNKNAFTRILDASATQGGLGLASTLDLANRQRRQASPFEIGGSAVGGALLGGAFQGVGEAGGALLNKLASRKNKIVPSKQTDFLKNRDLVDQELLGNLEGEDAQVMAQMLQPQSTQPNPAAQSTQLRPPVDPFDDLVGQVETAGPLALKDTINEANKLIRQIPSWDTGAREAAAKKLEAAISINEDWQLRQAQYRDPSGRMVPGERGSVAKPYPYGDRYMGATGMEEAAPIGPEAMQGPASPFEGYPNYLDFSQEPKPLNYPDYLDFSQELRYPNYLDFEQRYVPKKLTNVTKPLNYPDYLDFSQEPRFPQEYNGWGEPYPAWSLEDYLTLTQSPDNLQYPNYLDFGTNNPPQPPQPKAPQGEFRKTLSREFYGYEKPKIGSTMDVPPHLQPAMVMLAQTKARLEERRAQIAQLADEYIMRTDMKKMGSLKVSGTKTGLELNAKGQGLVDQLKAQILLENPNAGVESNRKPHIEVTGVERDWDTPDMQILDNEPEVRKLVEDQAADEAKFKELKGYVESEMGQFFNDPNPMNWPRLTAEIDYKGAPYSILLEKHQAAKVIKLADKRIDELKNTLLQDPTMTRVKKTKGKFSLSSGARAGSVLSGAAIMGADNAAMAADDEEGKPAPGWATAIGLSLIGAGVIKTPKDLVKLLSTTAGRAAARIGFIYADTLDHAVHLDKLLNKLPGQGLEAQILKHQALVLQSQFGVHFASQEQKSFLFQLIRDGAVSPSEAMSGTGRGAKYFAPLSAEQRQAIVRYYLYTKSMAKVARQYRAEVEAAEAAGLLRSPDRLQQEANNTAKDSVVKLDEALSPKVAPGSSLLGGDMVTMLQGNAMDALFTLNPKHHLLNLTDSIIAGASRVGPVNMVKAWRDLAVDTELSKAFKNSNLFGNFRAEKNEVARKLAEGKLEAPAKEFDFGSDKFNADRVFLAGLYQNYQSKSSKFKSLGYSTPQEYAKAVVSNPDIDPTVAMDAWAHAGEATMRVLGVDPLRMNRNILQRSFLAPLLSFVGQPLRMARLINEYAREGRTDRLAYMMGATMLLGGSAVIPTSIQLAGRAWAPDIEYALEKAANDLSLSGMAGAIAPELKQFIPNLSQKVQYDPFLPALFGSMGVGFENASKFLESGGATSEAIANGDYGAAADGAWKMAKQASMTTAAKVGPVPVSQAIKFADAFGQADSGYMPVYFFQGNKQIAQSESIDLDQLPAGRLAPFTNFILPGEPQLTAEARANRSEKNAKKKQEEPDMYFGDPIRGLTRKTKDVKKERQDDINNFVNNLLAGKN